MQGKDYLSILKTDNARLDPVCSLIECNDRMIEDIFLRGTCLLQWVKDPDDRVQVYRNNKDPHNPAHEGDTTELHIFFYLERQCDLPHDLPNPGVFWQKERFGIAAGRFKIANYRSLFL